MVTLPLKLEITELGAVMYACDPWEAEAGDCEFNARPGRSSKILSSKAKAKANPNETKEKKGNDMVVRKEDKQVQ